MALRTIIFASLYLAGIITGIALQQKYFNPDPAPCPPCPSLTCPPAISLNNFDAEKINNKKGNFHLHNTISNVQLVVDCEKDSALFNAIVKQAK